MILTQSHIKQKVNPAAKARKKKLQRRRAFFGFSTLISAIIEDAAPNKLVMLFTLANDKLSKKDFKIEGFAIKKLEMAVDNRACTLTLGHAAKKDEELIVVLNTGTTQRVINNVY